ncbi:MAG: single-stranded DNA-binding protein [Bacteroidetes bacterium 47-18]|nr:MAG: single-stranded DNA-binding protein [Bacteroidetes bacterium 47-18]
MRGVNKVVLVGNLGRDPDIQYIEGDIPVAKFPLATTEIRKVNGNVISETEWHTIVLWRGLADLAHKYLKKGSLVYVEGKLRTRSWEDKDKIKRFQTEVIGENLIMLEKRKENGNETGDAINPAAESNDENIDFELPPRADKDDDTLLSF